MEQSSAFLKDLQLPPEDSLVLSEKHFKDGAQYRIEIPSTEGPKSFLAVLDEADKLNLPIHRVSQGSGIQMLSIGGAGVFDGIFLTGIIAAFLA